MSRRMLEKKSPAAADEEAPEASPTDTSSDEDDAGTSDLRGDGPRIEPGRDDGARDSGRSEFIISRRNDVDGAVEDVEDVDVENDEIVGETSRNVASRIHSSDDGTHRRRMLELQHRRSMVIGGFVV